MTMKKKNVALIVLALVFLGVGIFFFVKKNDTVSEEVVQSSVDDAIEEAAQVSVDETCFELLEKMKIVKDAEVFDSEFLAAPCTLYQAYEILNTMKGQDGAEVSYSYHGEQISQEELLTLYLKELFQIDVKEAEGESFAFYANELEVTDYFSNKEAEATNNHLISLAYACVHYGLDDWENIKTVFQQMLESGFFNGMDISTFEVAAMDDIFNYGTLKCPATEIYDEDTGRTYYFISYFGNSYNSVTNKAKNLASIGMHGGGKEILQRPYFSQQNNLSDGTGFVFTRFPGNQAYLYNVETQTVKYIDTIKGNYGDGNYMYVSKTDKVYYMKELDGVTWVYRKDLKSDSEPEPIVKTEGGNLIHVSDDETYLSIVASSYGSGNGSPFVRIDIENKKVEVASHTIPVIRMPKGSNSVGHATVNPVYPELFFYAHIVDGTYLTTVPDRANIINVETGEIVTFNPGINPNKTSNNLPVVNIQINHESWSENGEYLYMTNMSSTGGENVPSRGMIRMNKDGTHYKYITSPALATDYWQWRYAYPMMSSHAAASGDDRYCVLQSYYLTLISQETNQIFPIAQIGDLAHTINCSARDSHPYHAHPVISRGDTYLVNWGQYYVPEETKDDVDSGLLGVAYYDFTEIDENELAEGGEYAYNEYVSRLSYEVPENLNYIEQHNYVGLDCESEEGTFFEKEAIHAKTGNYVYFNINTSIVDNMNDTVTITFDYYDNGAQDLKLIYTKAVEDISEYCYSEDGSIDIACTDAGEWKKAELVVHGNFETSGKFGTDFKIGSATSDVYIANIEVKKD